MKNYFYKDIKIKQPFRIRCKAFCLQVIQNRLSLIYLGKSLRPDNDKLRTQCEILRNKLTEINSDNQLCEFISKHKQDIRLIICAKNKAHYDLFNELLNEIK